MAGAIEPGMWVECVQNRLATTLPPIGLVVGNVYRVSRAGVTPADDEVPNVAWVRLVGVAENPRRWGFRAEWFRPIGRDNPDLIQSLSQPAPEAVRELVGSEA